MSTKAPRSKQRQPLRTLYMFLAGSVLVLGLSACGGNLADLLPKFEEPVPDPLGIDKTKIQATSISTWLERQESVDSATISPLTMFTVFPDHWGNVRIDIVKPYYDPPPSRGEID